MSLDVYLRKPGTAAKPEGSGIFVRENGSRREITREEWDRAFPGREPVVVQADIEYDCPDVYDANITHNLGAMAHEAGIYMHLWRPEEIGITHAAQLIEPLAAGLALLQSEPTRFRKLNPENGWGNYDGLVSFVARYLDACRDYPDAEVLASR